VAWALDSYERNRFQIPPQNFWSGVDRLVHGLNKKRFGELQNQQIYIQLFLGYREVFARDQREIEVEGPTLEAEAEVVLRRLLPIDECEGGKYD